MYNALSCRLSLLGPSCTAYRKLSVYMWEAKTVWSVEIGSLSTVDYVKRYMPCSLVDSCHHFGETFCPYLDGRKSVFLRNVGRYQAVRFHIPGANKRY